MTFIGSVFDIFSNWQASFMRNQSSINFKEPGNPPSWQGGDWGEFLTRENQSDQVDDRAGRHKLRSALQVF
jgi:hypothetical protein